VKGVLPWIQYNEGEGYYHGYSTIMESSVTLETTVMERGVTMEKNIKGGYVVGIYLCVA
jgi:hypothetical protein